MKRLIEKVNNRVVFLLSHGKSLDELEKRIYEYKDYDVCWVSFNNWTLLEQHILNNINKHFDIVYDAAPSKNQNKLVNIDFERYIRKPSFEVLLNRGSILISTRTLIRNDFKKYGMEWFYEKYKDRILFREDYFKKPIAFGGDTFCWMIYILTLAQPKKIIAFGADGYDGQAGLMLNSYYKKSERIVRKIVTYTRLGDLKGGTEYLNTHFNDNYKKFCDYTKVSPIREILNCNPNSLLTPFRKISYNDIKEEVYA